VEATMTKAVSTLILTILWCTPPDYAKLLESSKLSLSDAIEKAQKEVPEAKPMSAYIEDNEGKPCWFVFLSKGAKTVEVTIDLKEGSVLSKETLDDDDSKIAGAVKLTLVEAIQKAIAKAPGKAVYADFDVDEKGPAEAEVLVFADGKVTRVLVHAGTGDILKSEPVEKAADK
jgi:uncharacterized membrane protein YkoI